MRSTPVHEPSHWRRKPIAVCTTAGRASCDHSGANRLRRAHRPPVVLAVSWRRLLKPRHCVYTPCCGPFLLLQLVACPYGNSSFFENSFLRRLLQLVADAAVGCGCCSWLRLRWLRLLVPLVLGRWSADDDVQVHIPDVLRNCVCVMHDVCTTCVPQSTYAISLRVCYTVLFRRNIQRRLGRNRVKCYLGNTCVVVLD